MRLLVLVLLGSTLCLAQVDTGSVAGLITDASGAVVPEASVTIHHVETNTQTALKSNGSGYYAAAALRPGHYIIEVSKEGFRPQKSDEFDLRVQDRAEMNFHLQVGAANSEVTVIATAPLLEAETSSLGQVVEEKTLNELPLNGRNFIQLATLGAGTLPSTRTAERDNFIANGARAIQNSYLLDGVENKNRIFGFDKSSAQIIQPIIDGIQEFKVQTATFSAEFGQAAGGVVNVTLKSGTNAFHGNVFEFLRNSRVDASPYFQSFAGGGKPLFIQNQFGATFGGPVVKSRTFFFGSWQSSREVNAAPQIASVPTAAQHQGIFTSVVRDPVTKAAFLNNTIPVGRFDPVAAKLIALFPLPNQPGATRNYSSNPKERLTSDQYNVRVDHQISAKNSMFGRFSQSFADNTLPNFLPDPANTQGAIHPDARSLALSETHTFSSNKVNEFRFGFAYTHIQQDVDAERLFDQFGIKGALNEPKIKGLPQFLITNFTTLGTTTPGNIPISATGSGNFPSEKSGKIYQILDNFSWIHSRHTIRFGMDLQRVTMYAYATNSARPTFTFNGTYTGNALGDFLLGYVFNSNTSQQQVDTIIQHVYQGYIQDDWKVTPKLTLNAGLRYELPTPFVEEYDRQSNFILDRGPCYLQIVQAVDAGRCGLGRSLVHTDGNNFAPRLGLAYQATPKTVVRSGFGIFYGRDENLGIQRRIPNNPPFISSATFTGDATNPAFLLQNGIPANAFSLTGGSSDLNSYPLDFPLPYVVQWNLNVQRELGSGFVAQVAYTGSEAHKLAIIPQVNQALPGIGAVNSRRPYQGFANIFFYSPQANSNYHALLGKLERRFSHGLSLLASYTYGHSIDGGGNQNDTGDPGPQDVRNLAAQRGSSNFDVRHRFVLSGFYVLPFGKSGGPLNHIIRDWQISGIFSAQTGQPFTVTLSTDPSSTGTTARPNRIGSGALPADQRDPSHWFDLAAFATPPCICFGNSGRNIVRGPGFINLDFGLDRNFQINERFRVQFRAEAFNVANHPNFGLPNMALGNANAGIIGAVINPERQIQGALKLYF